ncbi:sulfur carrier protein ThiS [Caldimonas thermodepolymerans]|jgi:sulfur carrier protein|uniref:Sulfur carrier protein n=1 Tax=Caldimonas thermodepolymerans TaxID=215580 RepID=A0A2S5T6S6_9BURK|nr:sulfur carrier protein ThiS [Caldimonas thermodepolymerans]PPE70703.1 thiamine biosynthesis protein ThiS [Caldimonas thermodepolymerans]QPC33209.1 sulfur carrier protein ThiS [Caldimonas thermodepolymerans]RDH97528.1 sulfur carrier protein [Caldimonas thermodepolymerans]TCP09940.1 sulfur carrier protein [Caldimonas thermodepolymerans]UZG42646.1 sulfur carrier protein ThiS [Caldimonas thermodepolymerans]
MNARNDAASDAFVAADHPGAVPIHLNGEARHVPAGTTLAQLLERLGHAPASVATAVNGNFVARGARDGCVLQPGDHVTCFAPIVGG